MTTDSKASDVEAREREAFEAWFGALHLSPEWSLERLACDFGTLRKGDYISAECRYAFKAWLARASQQPSAQWIAPPEASVAEVMDALAEMALPHSPDTERTE